MSSDRDDPVYLLLNAAGWTMVRKKNHEIWQCPCGKHQVSIANTPSDCRTRKNELANIKRTKCPSLPVEEEPTPEPDHDDDLDDVFTYVCFCCKQELKTAEYRHTWVKHGQLTAHLCHHGVPTWHGEERAKERALRKGIRTL